jgi:hypothetical protein
MALIERLIPLLAQMPRWLLIFALVVTVQFVAVFVLLALYMGRALLDANRPPVITAIPVTPSMSPPPQPKQLSKPANDSRALDRAAPEASASERAANDHRPPEIKKIPASTTSSSSDLEPPAAAPQPLVIGGLPVQSKEQSQPPHQEPVRTDNEDILLAQAVMTMANRFPTARVTLQNLSDDNQLITEIRLNVSHYNPDVAYYIPYVAGETATIQLQMPSTTGVAAYRLDRPIVVPPGASGMVVVRFTAISAAGTVMGAHDAGAYRFNMSLRTITGIEATTGELGW